MLDVPSPVALEAALLVKRGHVVDERREAEGLGAALLGHDGLRCSCALNAVILPEKRRCPFVLMEAATVRGPTEMPAHLQFYGCPAPDDRQCWTPIARELHAVVHGADRMGSKLLFRKRRPSVPCEETGAHVTSEFA